MACGCWVAGLALLAAACAGSAGQGFVPDGRLKPDDVTNLMAADAHLSDGFRRGPTGTHGKFPVDGWTRADQALMWEVDAPRADGYAVNVLFHCPSGHGLDLTVASAGRQVTLSAQPTRHGWTRERLDGVLQLSRGRQTVTLQARPHGGAATFEASVFSVELVRPSVAQRLHRAALRLRSDTTWMQKAGYGLMCHWTSQTCPRTGAPKPYADAVRDFDVEGLARQVQETGAGFLVLTTSHAEQYFPAPLQSLDRVLPGRTASRDLVSDLAAALRRRGIKLMLYYHIGASSDAAWMRASGFWETDTSRLFGGWKSIVQEVGRRYGRALAGWWFDDGVINYYYRSPRWEELTRAAKAGFPGRVVAYNPWLWPSPTDMQDYCCGELFEDPSVGGLAPAGGDGRYIGGAYKGLQACATLIAEGDWVHSRQDAPVGPPRWTAGGLVELLGRFEAHRNVPIFNLEITQEGAFSPETVALFRQAHAMRSTRP
ncbi:MAG: alpha-L-fucosidase [Armatimonadetes bacterium]|nr:alpha-L-fucosidase [Armatimonadota bacterium]